MAEAPIDERGHTRSQAKAQEPLLDTGAKAASQELPVGGGDVMVPAQTTEEVRAQIENRAGTGDESEEERYAPSAGLQRVAPLTDDMHGRDQATTFEDRAPLREQIREGSQPGTADEGDNADEA